MRSMNGLVHMKIKKVLKQSRQPTFSHAVSCSMGRKECVRKRQQSEEMGETTRLPEKTASRRQCLPAEKAQIFGTTALSVLLNQLEKLKANKNLVKD